MQPLESDDLSSRIEQIPEHQLPKAHRNYFKKLAKHLDRFAVERAGEIFVSEQALRSLFADTSLPCHFTDEIFGRLAMPGSGISIRSIAPRGLFVPWRDVLARGGLPSSPTFADAGLSERSTLDDVRQVLQTQTPTLRDELFDPPTALGGFVNGVDALAPRPGILTSSDVSQFWTCVQGNLTGFALLAVMVGVMIIIDGTIVTGGLFSGAAVAALFGFFWIVGIGAVMTLVGCFYVFILAPLLNWP